MGDIFSVLAAGYTSTPPAIPSRTPYVAVDPKQWEGTWKRTYSTGEKFSFTRLPGRRRLPWCAYQSGTGPIKYQDVLIKDNACWMGDLKILS